MHLGVNFQNGYWITDMERFLIGTFGRQTGRSYRMMKEAVENAKNGRAVYVLLGNIQHKQYFEYLLQKVCADEGYIADSKRLGIKFETIQSLGGFSGVDLKNKRIIGSHTNCVLLVDHHFYAVHFGFAIQGFHNYDSET